MNFYWFFCWFSFGSLAKPKRLQTQRETVWRVLHRASFGSKNALDAFDWKLFEPKKSASLFNRQPIPGRAAFARHDHRTQADQFGQCALELRAIHFKPDATTDLANF